MEGANRSMQRRRRRRRSTAENPSLSSIFADELIEAILVRLPVSSLLRFKSVCKSWLSVISDPQFAKSQFDLAASPTHRLLLNCTRKLQFQSLDIESSPPNKESSVFNYLREQHVGYGIFTDFRSNSYLEVLGSCRGFLLLATRLGSSFTVCNPSTGEHRRIPSTSFRYSMSSLNGIGYDESTDDYLLVSINSYGCDRIIKLFSLKTNLPRSLTLDHEYHYIDSDSRSELFLHGSLHWLVTSGATKLPVVLAFNLVGRCLSEIALSPDLALEWNKSSYCLREMRGCLGLCYTGFGEMAEIWIMKEHKVQSSWTKIVFSTHDIYTKSCFFLICFTKCGDVFGSDELGRLLRLNDKGKLLAVWPRESKYWLYYSHVYTASLLSLPS